VHVAANLTLARDRLVSWPGVSLQQAVRFLW